MRQTEQILSNAVRVVFSPQSVEVILKEWNNLLTTAIASLTEKMTEVEMGMSPGTFEDDRRPLLV